MLVTRGDEQIPFEGFLYSEQMVLLERRTPDTLGARKVLLPYSEIATLKIVEVVKEKPFVSAGFKGALPKR